MSQDTLCYINLWAGPDREIDTTPFATADDALEEIGAGYANLRYLGTVVVEREGLRAPEDWSDDASRRRDEATEDWLAEQRERQAYRQSVL